MTRNNNKKTVEIHKIETKAKIYKIDPIEIFL